MVISDQREITLQINILSSGQFSVILNLLCNSDIENMLVEKMLHNNWDVALSGSCTDLMLLAIMHVMHQK